MSFLKREKPAWLKGDKDKYLNQKHKLSKEIDLQDIYSHCHSELIDQQAKRDQLIAFYLTVSGLVISIAFAQGVELMVRLYMFLFLAVIGFIWNIVILRYRIYKEVYWIACRTISSLFTFEDKEEITKDRMQAVFYRVMVKKSRSKLKVDKDGNYVYDKKQRIKWDAKKVFGEHWKSAEKLMYSTLVIISSGIFGVFAGGLLSIYFDLLYATLGGIGVALIAYLIFEVLYYVRLCGLYAVVTYPTDENFNRAYSKAWFLHIFVVNSGEFEKSRITSMKNKLNNFLYDDDEETYFEFENNSDTAKELVEDLPTSTDKEKINK